VEVGSMQSVGNPKIKFWEKKNVNVVLEVDYIKHCDKVIHNTTTLLKILFVNINKNIENIYFKKYMPILLNIFIRLRIRILNKNTKDINNMGKKTWTCEWFLFLLFFFLFLTELK
jgi:hypothetical protein